MSAIERIIEACQGAHAQLGTAQAAVSTCVLVIESEGTAWLSKLGLAALGGHIDHAADDLRMMRGKVESEADRLDQAVARLRTAQIQDRLEDALAHLDNAGQSLWSIVSSLAQLEIDMGDLGRDLRGRLEGTASCDRVSGVLIAALDACTSAKDAVRRAREAHDEGLGDG